MPPGPDAPTSRLPGLAELTFAPRDGRTRLVHSLTRPPLVVQRALYLDEALPDMAFVYLANPTAGILAGDDLRVSIRVCRGARAHLTTPAATKLYAMPTGEAQQHTELHVEAGALLEYLPEAIIPFAGARFSQTTTIDVETGGALIYGEILAAGRTAMGERLAYDRYASRLTVRGPFGPPVYHESYAIAPAERSPVGRGLLNDDAAVVGTLLVIATDGDGTLRERIRTCCGEGSAVRIGVSNLPGGGGVVVKAIGREIECVRLTLRAAWAAARDAMLGVEPPVQRKH